MADDPGITQRLRHLEEFRSVADVKLKRLENDRENDRMAMQLTDREIFAKLGNLEQQIQNSKEQLSEKIEHREEKILETMKELVTEVKNHNSAKNNSIKEEISNIQRSLYRVNNKLAVVSGIIIAAQVFLQYVLPLLRKG